MTPRGLGVALAKRLAVAGIVVVLILAAAFAIPAATNTPAERQPLDTPEYDAATLATTPIPAEGEIEVNESKRTQAGVVVIDESHSNRFDRADLAPMVTELTELGFNVRFYDGDQTFDQELSNVNAFVVIDPGREFDEEELDDVREFTSEGGHLLIVGEPNRKRVSASFFGTSISNQESALTTLAGRYDMSLGTSYLYNLETNGGNYKHLVAQPTADSGLDLESVTMFTAAPIHSRGGTVLLEAAPGTHMAGIDGTDTHAVAIYKEQENVVMVGDKSFLRSDRYNVGDNEQFVAYLVEFLITGERIDGSADDEEADTDDETSDGSTDDDTIAVNNTTTPAPTTPAASVSPPRLSEATLPAAAVTVADDLVARTA